MGENSADQYLQFVEPNISLNLNERSVSFVLKLNEGL